MKSLLFSLLLAVSGGAWAQAPAPTLYTYHIKGRIGQLNAPAKIYLVDVDIRDSATVTNGAFELNGAAALSQEARLILHRTGGLRLPHLWLNAPEAQDRIRVFLEPSTMVVISADSLYKATVKGGPLTMAHQQLQAALKPLEARQRALDAEYAKATEQQRQAPEFKRRVEADEEALDQAREQQYGTFIKAHPDSWVSLVTLQKIGGGVPQYAQVAPLFEALSPALKSTPTGREYGAMLQLIKEVAVGASAPNFTQQTPEGKMVSLADYRGQYVLVDFWASWCRPCRQENPNVVKVYNEYKGRNFAILGVSLDNAKSREKWLKAISDDQLVWTQVSDLKGWDNEVAARYHVRGIPQNFLVDPSGKIVAVNLRGERLKTTLARYLK